MEKRGTTEFQTQDVLMGKAEPSSAALPLITTRELMEQEPRQPWRELGGKVGSKLLVSFWPYSLPAHCAILLQGQGNYPSGALGEK